MSYFSFKFLIAIFAVLERRLSQQQDETSAERARLEGLVHRLEAHIQQQNTQLDEVTILYDHKNCKIE